MSKEEPKKKRKKKAAEGEESKEHKKNWREVNATPEEIKAFLNDHVYLRYNLVKYRLEARLPSEDPFWQNSELAQFVSDAENLLPRLTSNKLGRAMKTLGFERKRSHGLWGYNVVAYTAEEIKANKSMLAYDAESESSQSDDQDTGSDRNAEIF